MAYFIVLFYSNLKYLNICLYIFCSVQTSTNTFHCEPVLYNDNKTEPFTLCFFYRFFIHCSLKNNANTMLSESYKTMS